MIRCRGGCSLSDRLPHGQHAGNSEDSRLVKSLTYTPRVLTGIASGGAHVPTVHLGSTLAASYLQAYFTVAVFMAAAVGMVGAMLGVGRLLRPTRPQDQKYITYESG